MAETTQPQNQPLPPPKNYDAGSVDIWGDPSYVTNTDAAMEEFGQQIMQSYGDVPGVQEELARQISTNKMAVRKTQAESLTEYVTDTYREKLAEIGRYAKQGDFAGTYTKMAIMLNDPQVLAALGNNGARDLLSKSFGNYTEEKANLYSNGWVSTDKLKALDDMIQDAGVRSMIPTSTLKYLQEKRGSMEKALGSQFKPSEIEKRSSGLDLLRKKYKTKYGEDKWKEHWPLSEKQETEYVMYGTGTNVFDTELSAQAYQISMAKEMSESGLFTPKELLAYKASGTIPAEPKKAAYFENIELATKIDDERKKHTSSTGQTLPPLTQREKEGIWTTGKFPAESDLKAKENLIQLMITAGIAVDKQQRAIFLATGDYKPTQMQDREGQIAAMEAVLDRSLTESEKLIALKLTPNALVNIDTAVKPSMKAAVDSIASDIKGLQKAGAQAQSVLSNLNAFEQALTEAMKSETAVMPTGAFAKPVLMASKVAVFLKDVFPNNPVLDGIVKKLGDPATKELADATSKRMLLIIAKYIGRITNLSLRFARDSVPGILKTPTGNRLIIAVMRKQANFDAGLARIGERHTQRAVAGSQYGAYTDPSSGILHPDYTTEKHAFIEANNLTKDPELERLFKEAQIAAATLAGKKKPKIITWKDAQAKAPDPYIDKDFAKYIKSRGENLKEGVKHTKTYRDPRDGLTYFAYQYPDKTGFTVSTHWGDTDPIKPSPVQDPIKPQDVPNTEIDPDKTWFNVKNLGELTVDDIANNLDQVKPFMEQVLSGDNADEIVRLLGINPAVVSELKRLLKDLNK